MKRVQRPRLFLYWVQSGAQEDVWWLWNTHGLPDAAVDAGRVACLMSNYKDEGYIPAPWARQRDTVAFRSLMGWCE